MTPSAPSRELLVGAQHRGDAVRVPSTRYGAPKEQEPMPVCLMGSPWQAPGAKIAKTGNCRTRNTQPLVGVRLM